MLVESLTGEYDVFMYIVFFNAIIFYVFRHYLRINRIYMLLGYIVLLVFEIMIQKNMSGVLPEYTALLLVLIYLIYDLWAIHIYGGKVLAVVLLTIPFFLLFSSVVLFAKQHLILAIPKVSDGVVFITLFFVFLGAVLYYVHHALEPLFAMQEKNPWWYLVGYESMLILIVILANSCHEPIVLQVLFSRVLLLLATITCIYIMTYLCKSIRSREYTSHLLNSIQHLQNMEKQRYEISIKHWRSSRRMRHDFCHYMVSITALARARNGEKLEEYLRRILAEI